MANVRLTVTNKILLHLLEFSGWTNQWEAPFETTQQGIANAVGIVRSAVPRATKKLMDEKLIEERVVHVPNMTRRRKTYHLSSEGVGGAQALMDEISTESLKVERGGEVESMTVAAALEVLHFTPLQLALGCRSGEVMGAAESEPAAGHWQLAGDQLPAVRTMLGRKAALGEFGSWFENNLPPVVFVQGMAGIGKSTLAASTCQLLAKQAHVFYHRFHEWDGVDVVLEKLAPFLSAAGGPGFASSLVGLASFELNSIGKLLRDNLPSNRFVLVFDDYHKASERLEDFFSMLKGIVLQRPHIKLAIFSREWGRFYSRQEVVNHSVHELALRGLEEGAAAEMLAMRGVEKERAEHFYHLTEGHPLALELIDPAEDSIRAQKDLRRFLQKEIFGLLSSSEREVLQVLSVQNQSVHVDAVFEGALEEVSFDAVDLLVEKGLLQEEGDGDSLHSHDLIREYAYSRLSPRQRGHYHEKAATWWEPQEVDGVIQATHHWLWADKLERAVSLALEGGEQLNRQSLRFSAVLDEFPLERIGEEVGKSEQAALLLLRGSYHVIEGRWSQAVECLEEGRKLAALTGDTDLVARMYNRFGELIHGKGTTEAPPRHIFEDAVAVAAKASPVEQARAANNMALYWLRHGKPDQSIPELKKAAEMLRQAGETARLCSVLINQGRAYIGQGHHEKAQSLFEEALELATTAGFDRSWAQAQVVLVELEVDHGVITGEVPVLERLDEAISIFRTQSASGGEAAALMAKARALIISEEYTRATEVVKQGQRLAVAAVLPRIEAEAWKVLAELEPENRADHLQQALRIFTRIGEIQKIQQVQAEMEK